MEKNNYIEIDLVQIWKVLWKKMWLLVIVALLGATAGYCCARFLIKPQYQSQAKVYVNNTDTTRATKNQYYTNSDLQAAQSLVETYLVIMKSRSTLETVIKNQKLPYTYDVLEKMVSGKAENETEIFTVTVKSSDSKEAARIVNGIIDVLPTTIAKVVDGASVRTIDHGIVIDTPVSPSKSKYAAVGGLIGLLLMMVILIIHALRDTKIHDETYIENLPGEKPLLAAIPDLSPKTGRKKSAVWAAAEKIFENRSGDGHMLCGSLHFSAAEAYKLLRMNILYSLPDGEGCTVIGITSAVRGEGKSTTSINLAYTFAENGRKVLLIEGDMRLPNLADRLNVKPDPGLSNAIGGFDALDDVIQQTGIDEHFYIISSGKIPPNPAELLSSKRMAKIMAELRENFDHIIIDLPPLSPVSDALAVAPYIDGMVMISREGYSEFPPVAEAVQKLNFAGIKLFGYVLTKSSAASKSAYYKYGRKKTKGYGSDSGYYGKVDADYYGRSTDRKIVVQDPDKPVKTDPAVMAEIAEAETEELSPAVTQDEATSIQDQPLSTVVKQENESVTENLNPAVVEWEAKSRIVQVSAVAGKPMVFVKSQPQRVVAHETIREKKPYSVSVNTTNNTVVVPPRWDLQQNSDVPFSRQGKNFKTNGPMVLINVAMVNENQ